MEEKILQYERIKASLLTHCEKLDLVQAETGYPMLLIWNAREKMRKELKKLPEHEKIYVADNTFDMVLKGSMMRKEIIHNSLGALHRREQIIVCAHCDTEIVGEPGEVVEFGMCPKCNVMVRRSKRDRLDIFAEKRALLKQDRDEDKMVADYAARLFAIKNLPRILTQQNLRPEDTPSEPPVPPLGVDFKGTDKEIAAAIAAMKPDDRQMFAQKLLEKMCILDVEIEREEKA